MKIELDSSASSVIKTRLNELWDISGYYWYPLSKTNKNNVIAFNYRYINQDNKIDFLWRVLQERGISKIYEYWGNGKCYEYTTLDPTCLFWKSDGYFYECFNEGFWFSEDMDWIIYFTHEETVTIGGSWIIDRVKSQWDDWQKNIDWDTKNK